MLAIWVKAKIKATMRDKFLKAIEADALGSERDEPGCLRFNVLQDDEDENVYYFYEVYKDQAALEAHRNTPHYAIWRGVADVLDGPHRAHPLQARLPGKTDPRVLGPRCSALLELSLNGLDRYRPGGTVGGSRAAERSRPQVRCAARRAANPASG